VYLGRDPDGGAAVALKVLREDIDPRVRDQVRMRFLAEEAIARSIGHPTIVTVRETSPRGERPCYIAMDYVDGLPFCDHFARLRAPTEGRPAGRLAYFSEVCRLGHGVARAMAVAHERSVIHRDLKPDNVLVVSGEGPAHVRILDFGIAKAPPELFPLERVAAVTRYYTELGTVMGSPPYMAPEQNGAAHAVSGKADVYALGVMLLVTLLGLDARALEQGEARIVLPAGFDELVRGTALPQELRELLRSMTDEQPEKRPEMSEVALRLQRAARGDSAFGAAVERWVRGRRVPGAAQLLELARYGERASHLTEDEHAFLRRAPLEKLEQLRSRLRLASGVFAVCIAASAVAIGYAAARPSPALLSVLRLPHVDANAPSAPAQRVALPARATQVVPDPHVDELRELRVALESGKELLAQERKRSGEQAVEIRNLGAALAEQRRLREQAQRQAEQNEARRAAAEREGRECLAETDRQAQALAECRRDVETGLAQVVESAERLRLCTRSLREQAGAQARPSPDDPGAD